MKSRSHKHSVPVNHRSVVRWSWIRPRNEFLLFPTASGLHNGFTLWIIASVFCARSSLRVGTASREITDSSRRNAIRNNFNLIGQFENSFCSSSFVLLLRASYDRLGIRLEQAELLLSAINRALLRSSLRAPLGIIIFLIGLQILSVSFRRVAFRQQTKVGASGGWLCKSFNCSCSLLTVQ